MSVVTRSVLILVAASLLASCAGGGKAAPASSSPVFNLSGYSAAYRKGHADACAQRRDERLLREQGDYMMGWNDGRLACSRR